MIFCFFELVRDLSHFMVPAPRRRDPYRDPAGAALGLPGTPYLRAGDVVDVEIDGLGRRQQTFQEV
ncbi:hypothetical protein ACWD1W_25835 [Streptomyces olivaceoviridis]